MTTTISHPLEGIGSKIAISDLFAVVVHAGKTEVRGCAPDRFTKPGFSLPGFSLNERIWEKPNNIEVDLVDFKTMATNEVIYEIVETEIRKEVEQAIEAFVSK